MTLVLALLAVAAAPAGQHLAQPERQALAMVRILRPVRIEMGVGALDGQASVRRTQILSDGTMQRAILVEFS